MNAPMPPAFYVLAKQALVMKQVFYNRDVPWARAKHFVNYASLAHLAACVALREVGLS